MIGKLLDRIPEPWAERWARRLNLVHIVFMACFLAAWWLAGLRTLVTHRMGLGAATFFGFGWVPTMLTWMIVQGIHTHHQFKRSRERMAAFDRTDEELMERVRRVNAEIENHRREQLGLPLVDQPPAMH